MRSTLKNIVYVFTASTLSKIIGAITSIVLPNILDPSNYGVWVTLLLIISYAPIAALGTVEALLRQYPYYIGKGDVEKARECEQSVLGSICITTIFLIICSISTPLIVAKTSLETYEQEIMMMLLVAAISSFTGFFYHRFAAHHCFKSYSIVDTLRAIVTISLVVPFAWLWGLKGAVIAFLIAEIVVCISSVLLSFRLCGKVQIRLDGRLIWQSIQIGFPITIVWWALTLQSSVDRVMSVSFLGKEMTGYYGLGISIVSMLVIIPGSVNRVLYPKISEGLGKNKNVKQLSSLIISPVRILSIFIPVLVGVLIILLPTLYMLIFPKYIPGLQSAQLLLLSFFFAGLIGNGANYLIAKNKQNILFGFVVLSLIANAACAMYFISLGLSIVGVALSTGIAATVLVTLIWKLVLKYLEYGSADQWRSLIGLYSPFILMICLLFIYHSILPEYLNSSGVLTAVYVLIFACSYLMIILFIPPYSKWCREIYNLFKMHLYGSHILSESQPFK